VLDLSIIPQIDTTVLNLNSLQPFLKALDPIRNVQLSPTIVTILTNHSDIDLTIFRTL
jgi:hypothetical protein